MTSEKRRMFEDLINDSNIFPPSYLYRPNDPNFGLQTTIKMLLYPGIETKAINNYVAAISKHSKRKKYVFREIKTAVAPTSGTRDIVYEVVYQKY